MRMNKEKYNDPTAERAIANAIREEKKKNKDAVISNGYKRKNESLLQGSRQKL